VNSNFLRNSRFSPGERTPCTQGTGDCMGARIVLGALKMWKISCRRQESRHDFSVFLPVTWSLYWIRCAGRYVKVILNSSKVRMENLSFPFRSYG